jgi:hypothetical protein
VALSNAGTVGVSSTSPPLPKTRLHGPMTSLSPSYCSLRQLSNHNCTSCRSWFLLSLAFIVLMHVDAGAAASLAPAVLDPEQQ